MSFEAKLICNDVRPSIVFFSIGAELDFVLGYGRAISVVNKKKILWIYSFYLT